MLLGSIAIVGRPNVGKSALFNRLVGKRIAIVHDMPGVTRDRVMAEATWQGHRLVMIDTGGIGLSQREKSNDVITQAALDQVHIAIESAEVIYFVCDVTEGIVPLDREVAQILRTSGKPVALVVNKVDQPNQENHLSEFTALGFQPLFAVSTIHKKGIDPLFDWGCKTLLSLNPDGKDSALDASSAERPEGWKLAFVGRPNVGKSSLLNALTRSDRVIVSPIPGTTRDSVDVPFQVQTEAGTQHFTLIDTAGIRKKRRIDDSVEFYSVNRSEKAIERCDLAVLVIDAEEGVTVQDKKIAGLISENHRACIIVINKWDLVQHKWLAIKNDPGSKTTQAQEKEFNLAEFAAWVQEQLFFIDYAPVIFTSSTERFNLDRFLEAIQIVISQFERKIPTRILNTTLHQAIEDRQPPTSSGHRLKFYYATQTESLPPSFLLFINRKDLFSDTYQKYLVGTLRKAFGYEGCPIVLIAKPRPKTVDSIRTSKRPQKPKPKSSQNKPTPGSRRKMDKPQPNLRKSRKKKAPK